MITLVLYPVVVDGDFEGHGYGAGGKGHRLGGGVRRRGRNVPVVGALVLESVGHLKGPEPATRAHESDRQVAVGLAHRVGRARETNHAPVPAHLVRYLRRQRGRREPMRRRHEPGHAHAKARAHGPKTGQYPRKVALRYGDEDDKERKIER